MSRRLLAGPIGFLLLAGVVGCESATAPDSPLAGQYELMSVNGDTTLAGQNPDISPRPFEGFVILRNDRSYSYALIMYSCTPLRCTGATVGTFGGTWTTKGSSIELIENADGTTRRWDYSGNVLSGIESKFFPASANLQFRKCGTAETGGCALYPGT